MAANSTLLATQCATGVPIPRCHVRRNLVTKTHNPTFMAVNPAVQYEAGALVSSPSQLHRNLVPKRDKTIVAAYPITLQFTTDIPEYTKVLIKNFTEKVLHLDDRNIWKGSRSKIFPEDIQIKEEREFTHHAVSGDEVIGSVVGLEYLIGDGPQYKWIIAWSNAKNEVNKVYTLIVENGTGNWDEIKINLDKSVSNCAAETLPYSADILIDPTSATPTVTATLQLKLLDDDKKGSKA